MGRGTSGHGFFDRLRNPKVVELVETPSRSLLSRVFYVNQICSSTYQKKNEITLPNPTYLKKWR